MPESMVWHKAYFDILDRLVVTHECETDKRSDLEGRTNIIVANAPLGYVARPKSMHLHAI